MTLFLGGFVARLATGDLRADVLQGREWLVKCAGQDLGFDPSIWHEHLAASDAGGYRWMNQHLGFPHCIRDAQENPEWRKVIANLQRDRGEIDLHRESP